MNLISNIIKNIRNLLPYFLLIAIYFFFINLEASNERSNNKVNKNQNKLTESKSTLDDMKVIEIPVIPYEK